MEAAGALYRQRGYDPLLEMLARIEERGFMRSGGVSLWSVAETPEEAVAAAIAAK